jgi:hypothetical protein
VFEVELGSIFLAATAALVVTIRDSGIPKKTFLHQSPVVKDR